MNGVSTTHHDKHHSSGTKSHINDWVQSTITKLELNTFTRIPMSAMWQKGPKEARYMLASDEDESIFEGQNVSLSDDKVFKHGVCLFWQLVCLCMFAYGLSVQWLHSQTCSIEQCMKQTSAWCMNHPNSAEASQDANTYQHPFSTPFDMNCGISRTPQIPCCTMDRQHSNWSAIGEPSNKVSYICRSWSQQSLIPYHQCPLFSYRKQRFSCSTAPWTVIC